MRFAMPTTLQRPWFLALLLAAPALKAQSTYKDDKYGFKIVVPADYNQVPLDPTEEWVVAKFIYKRVIEGKKDWVQMTPEIRVIVFPDEAIKRKAKKSEEKDAEGGDTVVLVLNNPYKNYLDFLERTYSQGGWHVAKEEKAKVDGLDVIKRTILVEKLANGERTITAWEYRLPDAAYVIHSEVLTEWASKYVPEFTKMMAAFKRVERAGGGSLTGPVTGNKITTRWWDPGMTPEQRQKYRSEHQAQVMKKAIERLTDGWKYKQTDKFLFLWHSKDKFAEMTMKQAAAMRKFMDERFNSVGQDYVIPFIVRICASPEEARSYMDSSGNSWSANNREVVVYEDKDWGTSGSGFVYLNAGIARGFMNDKNQKLWWALPPWLDDGLSLYISRLVIDTATGKLVSKPDEWDMEVIRDKLRKGEFKPAKDILTAREDAYSKTADRVMSMAICKFLMDEGQKHPKFGPVVANYLKVMEERIKELEAAEKKNKPSARDEDDEDAKLEQEWKSRRSELLDHCFKKVFSGWTDNDWRAFDEAWKKALK
jgi:hypothetical protein